MKFTSLPEAYNSFREPLLCSFDTESATAKDVEILIKRADDDKIIGRKRLKGVTSGQIDIAPYLRNAVQPTLPQEVKSCTEIDTGTQIRVYLESDGVVSERRRYMAAKVDLEKDYMPLTTQIEHRTIAADEFDTISYFAYPEIVVEVLVEAYGKSYSYLRVRPDSGGQRTIAITALPFDEVPDELKVSVEVDGVVESIYHYQIKQNLKGSRRLAWLNHNSAPEIYTFPLRKSALIEATRRHMETIWGKEAAAVESHGELKLLSAYEPEEQIEALGEILSSPKVWLIRGCKAQRVELRAERTLTMPCGEMGIIEVDVCTAKEGEKL